jgi:hypothetical protein
MSADAKKTVPRNSTGPALPARLAHALSVIAESLPNPWDESTEYFVPFHAALAEGEALDAETPSRA